MDHAVAAAKVDGSRRGWLRRAPVLVALLVAYFLAGKLGLHFAHVHASASAVWPPTGIALAAVLLFGVRVWPAIFAGAFLVNLDATGAALSSLGIAAGNTLEATVGGALVARYAGGVRVFERAGTYLMFVVFGGLLGTAVSATVGVLSLLAGGDAAWAAAGAIWLTWWFGDMAGALIVTPVLVLWGARGSVAAVRDPTLEAALLTAVVVATGALVFAHAELSRLPLPFLCIPPLIWAAFRFGPRQVATSVLMLSAIATWATVRGFGPFATGTDNESLLLLQAFMGTIAMLTMSVAGLVEERKAIERERSALLERERMARAEAETASHAKDEFLAMLSHELRNPLAAIVNAAHVLSSPAAPTEFAKRAIDVVSRQARHLSALIDDLLDIARLSSGKVLLAPEVLDLGDIVNGSLNLLRSGGQLERHQLTADIAPAWVRGDRTRLTQVVDNLLQNALKYTPTGGLIEVQTSSEREDVVLRVRDNGVGMTPDLLERVFEPFTQGPRTLDRAQGGLGLGLALAQRLVRAHGGRIVAASPGPSQGSSFTVRLPRVDATASGDRA